MVSLSLLLSATAALAAVAASILPQSTPRPLSASVSTDVATSQGTYSFTDLQYCRNSTWNDYNYGGGWAQPGPMNVSIHEYPCDMSYFPTRCTLIETLQVNVNLTKPFSWIVDVPVNVTYIMLYSQARADGLYNSTFSLYTTIPPYDNEECDQSLLNLTFSAASLSNATGRIGSPHNNTADNRPTSGAETVVGARTYPVAALALVAAGAAALL